MAVSKTSVAVIAAGSLNIEGLVSKFPIVSSGSDGEGVLLTSHTATDIDKESQPIA